MVIAQFQAICRVLDRTYPNPSIPLDFRDAYTLLVAVVLSAQCSDHRVNAVTPNLWKYGTHPADIAALGADKIAEIIRPCGLYTRKSQHIEALSKAIVENYGGVVPSDRAQLEALPGVGRKTANVILSHVFHIPAFAVDTHVMRLAVRWGWSSSRTAEGVERDLCAIFPAEDWMRRHLQMIYFGRNVCTARHHDPSQCMACRLVSP